MLIGGGDFAWRFSSSHDRPFHTRVVCYSKLIMITNIYIYEWSKVYLFYYVIHIFYTVLVIC